MSEISAGVVGALARAPRRPSATLSGRSSGYARVAGLLLVADLLALEIASLASFLAFDAVGLAEWKPYTAARLCFAAAVGVLANAALGLYDPVGLGSVERFRLRALGCALLPFLALAILVVSGEVVPVTPILLALGAAISLPLQLVGEAGAKRLFSARPHWGMPTVLIGTSNACTRMAKYLWAHPEFGLWPIGVLAEPGVDAAAEPLPLPYLGTPADAPRFGERAAVALVVLSPEFTAASISLGTPPFRRVLLLPALADAPCLGLKFRQLSGTVGIEFRPGRLYAPANLRLKRIIDLALAVPLLIAAAPFIALLALAIKLISPGPAFFVQKRVGWRGSAISVYKLRSMYVDAEQRLQALLASDPVSRSEWQRYVKLPRDPRILPVIGSFIRKTSLDELPQLWNVVKGDISLVGPRPFPSYHVDMFGPEFQQLRASVPPGLTGFWQVSDRSNGDLAVQELADTFYVRNWSIWLDLYIALRTLPAILAARGAR